MSSPPMNVMMDACGKATLGLALAHVAERLAGSDELADCLEKVARLYRYPAKDDRVLIRDRHSAHYGKRGLVAFVKDGRAYISVENPRSIAGSELVSFLPGDVEVLPTDVEKESVQGPSEERRTLARVATENVALHENLTATQDRCTQLLIRGREMRQRILELGGEDPGIP